MYFGTIFLIWQAGNKFIEVFILIVGSPFLK